MHKTRNDLTADVRARVSLLLNSRLATAIDLYLQTKHAHWNVKGPSFIALHELFDKLGEELEEYIDEMAERAVALGAVAEGTTNSVIERTQLAKYPAQISEGLAHVDALANAYATFGKAVRADRRGGQGGRCRHQRSVHRHLAGDGQEPVVAGGAPPSGKITLPLQISVRQLYLTALPRLMGMMAPPRPPEAEGLSSRPTY
jgi:starvation-inducible DNA-binding protein